MSEAKIIISTCGSKDEARTIADTLVEERLAACVHILPAGESIYRWQGKIEHEPEHTLLIKTTESTRDKLIARLKELHSYEVPEIIVVPVEAADPAYLAWLIDSTQVQPG